MVGEKAPTFSIIKLIVADEELDLAADADVVVVLDGISAKNAFRKESNMINMVAHSSLRKASSFSSWSTVWLEWWVSFVASTLLVVVTPLLSASPSSCEPCEPPSSLDVSFWMRFFRWDWLVVAADPLLFRLPLMTGDGMGVSKDDGLTVSLSVLCSWDGPLFSLLLCMRSIDGAAIAEEGPLNVLSMFDIGALNELSIGCCCVV